MIPDKLNQFTAAFHSTLNALKPQWIVHGDALHGPDGAVVRFAERHQASSNGHVDVEFILNHLNPDSPRLWDCVSGFGPSLSDCAHSAAHIWTSTSGVTLLEMKYSGRGEFADHFHGHEPEGLLGWHSICSAVLGYGRGSSADALQAWWLGRQTALPAIAPLLRNIPGDGPHAVKIFFGAQDVAEVRVDGEIHAGASAALLALDWPRIEPPGFLRVFVIALHRE